ncbi:glucuronate isomerase [Simiduia agarivorans]|uniref:Uronate isomerase n=1 Tax=Simiduia agarivorans (strain DSM 21679 / JCM 13881 / BCRC 17597 / SA1) TaxID=1117647 RepID=K4KIG0_SIMAS|nr:glucuronate isomerase [Simiduia agarivorans]AFU98811.1 glucuronate isomerase [Simiduia agarivorans SA1 = DSM 21679]
MLLHPDRLFPAEPGTRAIARALYTSVAQLPIISPHGHTDPAWFAINQPFTNPTELLIKPDHYVFRMLYSQGIGLQQLGIRNPDADPEQVWQLFARHFYLFRGTPSSLWLNYVFEKVFDIDQPLNAQTAAHYYKVINDKLAQPAFLPRALFERFNIEVLTTTESPLDDLRHHQAINDSGWHGRVLTAYRPDDVLDPDQPDFTNNLARLAELTGEDTSSWHGYLNALRNRRAYFKSMGATSTDHGHATANTADLSRAECETLFAGALAGTLNTSEADLFRAQMLTEMAGMSVEDGLVMQLHPGCHRNHNGPLFERFGRDKGADIPVRTEYVKALHPLLNKYGNDPRLSLIVFTLDETNYSRELAPLAGHYPALKLGPAWWFHDSPEGMRRYREQVTETAGFYNTVGFNDDTRAFLSIPARHDLARRMDCAVLAQWVADHRLTEQDAFELAHDLSYTLAKNAYKL